MTKCRLVTRTGTRYTAVLTQPPGPGQLQEHWHRAEVPISKEDYDAKAFDKYRGIRAKCESCGIEFSDDHPGLAGFGLWDTEDGGNRHPGDMYWSKWHDEPKDCPFWDNCDPRGHLVVVLPNGHPFDSDLRASNCASPGDRTHRCWRKEGTPPMITLGNGCGGSSSIQVGEWHGHLRNGELVPV